MRRIFPSISFEALAQTLHYFNNLFLFKKKREEDETTSNNFQSVNQLVNLWQSISQNILKIFLLHTIIYIFFDFVRSRIENQKSPNNVQNRIHSIRSVRWLTSIDELDELFDSNRFRLGWGNECAAVAIWKKKEIDHSHSTIPRNLSSIGIRTIIVDVEWAGFSIEFFRTNHYSHQYVLIRRKRGKILHKIFYRNVYIDDEKLKLWSVLRDKSYEAICDSIGYHWREDERT